MPNIDGLHLAMEFRNYPMGEKLPIVILTSLGKKDTLEELEKAKLSAFILKPVKQSQLFRTLISAIYKSDDVSFTKFLSPVPQANKKNKTYSIKILLAEDNVVNQMVATKMLANIGYKADVASNGREAFDTINKMQYDLIFMDILMPEMDGFEATRAIRKLDKSIKQPKIIAMTANAMTGDREKCLRAGMDDYLSKPIKAEELVAKLSHWGELINLESANEMEQIKKQELPATILDEKNKSFSGY
ncbi:MAG: response regulator [Ignavibacteriales bacterium]|nr:response regulator [Ignavibacteriales bacterium]